MGDGGGEAVRRLRMWKRDEKGEEAILRVSGWAAESKAQFLFPAPGSCLALELLCSLLWFVTEATSVPLSL